MLRARRKHGLVRIGTAGIIVWMFAACGGSSDEGGRGGSAGTSTGGSAGKGTGGSSGKGSGGSSGAGTGGGGTAGSATGGSAGSGCVNDGDPCAPGKSVTPCIVGFDCCRNVCTCTNAGSVGCQTVCDAGGGGGNCGGDAGSGCPSDFFAADGTPCAEEGKFCGGGCTDPCQFCNVLRCEQGKWQWLEAPPNPNCNDR